ncbi:MAG: hypothetical protein NTZ05_16695 [Chloroflexi bacterium]|nr:hypothetical protein [Chloroflexota bacterium]
MSGNDQRPVNLFLGPDPWLATCRGCGAKVDQPPMGISVKQFVQYCKEAEAAHAECEAPERTEQP